ncbi:galactose oxidase [Melanogaster broomeanus]|nr:galactose oxidase [Melanogaster broomeanus]
MAKDKKSVGSSSKAAAKAQKKAKATQKTARKEKKKGVKTQKDKDDQDEEDLEGILDKMRREWEEAHTVTEELVAGPPSRRANATLTACPNGNHLWCIGGEYFSDDGKAYFYNDVFRYSPDKPTCPGPRSAHSVVASPSGGGKLFLFGGEFSSLYQNSFHHYRDFWVFDIPTHSWERIETKVRPSARSGHRMTMWKHFIVLFGGFYDPGYRTQYLNDTWLFDTQEYKWRQIEFKESERKPSPRSGFSFLPTPDGIVLHGGYCKEYSKGKRPVGVILDDTWFLRYAIPLPSILADHHPHRITLDTSLPNPLTLKWERRKTPQSPHTPSSRAGCTMALWYAKSTGVMFGGVTDEERGEEGLESVFWNDMYGYQLAGNGRWVSMILKRPKKKGGGGKKKHSNASHQPLASSSRAKTHEQEVDDRDTDGEPEEDRDETTSTAPAQSETSPTPASRPDPEVDPDDPNSTKPVPRYNAMLAVLRNTLYIYGGIFELGSREYTLDDFYYIQLDKLERFVCLKPSDIVIPTEAEESSDDGDDSEEEWWKSEEVHGDEKEKRIRGRGTVRSERQDLAKDEQEAEMDSVRSAEDVISTPAPGETLAMFYARSREYWAQKAHNTSDNRGKQLRRDGFGLAGERYGEYKPILEEVEKILAEAGLDEEEMKMHGAKDATGVDSGQSRNRR